jgi:geranylgeranyl diphosphate synthase type II
MNPRLRNWFESRRRLVEKALAAELRRAGAPARLSDAMGYSLLSGGKRLRPVLALAAAEACGKRPAQALSVACAVEMIHAYSLIHDDLPAMDDDDLRRGRPTNHKVFGEAAAILAGDGLLTLAFETASRTRGNGNVTTAVRALARAAGAAGMVGGQLLDLDSEGSSRRSKASKRLQEIHSKKTAALISASLECGALAAGGSARQVRALAEYGRRLGLAFQIVDDVLDVVGDKRKLGKNGSDADNDKLTFPAVHGIERSRELAAREGALAKAALRPLGRRAWMLDDLADYVLTRDK